MGILLHLGLRKTPRKKILKVHVQIKEYVFFIYVEMREAGPFPLCKPESNAELNNYNIAEPSGGEKKNQ